MQDSFILYTEYAEHMALLNMEQRGVLVTAIFAHEMGQPLPDMDIGVKMAFSFIRANLDRNRQKYEDVKKKRSAAGVASARAKTNKKEQESTKSTHVKMAQQTATNSTVNVNDNDNENVNVNEDSRRFRAPTPDEVRAYCEEQGIRVDADRFVNYYASKGWKVGKSPMKDWKAAARNWAKDNGKQANRFNNFEPRDYDFDDLETRLLRASR